MNTRCDFYIMDHDRSLIWIGSNFKNGDYTEIPTKILVQGDQISFEEEVISFLEEEGGIISSEGHKWPWHWNDSQLTDYTYIFHVCSGKVLVCKLGGRPMNPIKLLQGMDELGADVGVGLIRFPIMRENKIREESLEENGSKLTEVI